MSFKSLLPFYLLCFWAFSALGQVPGMLEEVKVEVEGQSFIIGETIQIKISIFDQNNYDISDIPEIPLLEKLNQTTQHGTILRNNVKVKAHYVTLNYQTFKAGEIELDNFSISINGEKYTLPKKIIQIHDEKQAPEFDFVEDVGLLVETSRRNVYIGESFLVKVSFYISDNTTTQWRFPSNIENEIEALSNNLKFKNCLITRKNILNIVAEHQTVKDKSYKIYKALQVILTPITTQPLVFSDFVLNMEKQKGVGFQKQPLRAKGFTILPKELPRHPLQSQIPVGDFNLSEKIPQNKEARTGRGFDYDLILQGSGNMSNVEISVNQTSKYFEIIGHSSNSTQIAGELEGQKIFKFKIIPKVSGIFQMKDYFNLIYFNTSKKKYDTLRPKQSLTVSGATIIDDLLGQKDIYFNIENQKTYENPINYRKLAKFFANFVVLVSIIFLAYIYKLKPK